MEKPGSQKLSLPVLKRHGSTGPGHLTGQHTASHSHDAERLLAVQRNYEAISAMMQVKQDELRKVLFSTAPDRIAITD